MTPTLPTAADLAALPPLAQPLPEGCLCPTRSATGCHLLRMNLARWWGEAEPEGDACGCPCHAEEPR